MNSTSTIKPSKKVYIPSELIESFLAYVMSLGGGAAIWRLPNTKRIYLLADFSGGLKLKEYELQDLDQGFLIAPFQNTHHQSIHLKSEFQITIELNEEGDNTRCTIIDQDQADQMKGLQDFIKNNIRRINFPSSSIETSTSKEHYIESVKKGIEQIKEENFYKVVPSKIKVLEHKNDLNLGSSFLQACEKYQNAFVNLSYTPFSGIWFGASPETLIEDNQNGSFKTVALAGTQAKNEKNIADTAWTQKEIEEQAYVSRYIIDCFKKIRLREYEENGPKTIQAGNLLHLKTTYKVDKQSINFPELASVMLKLLHPTSAVCGMPKVSAMDFLSKHEAHDRAYFSGFLGPVNQEEVSSLFVNLRCCKINKDFISFYAGAGITEDSNPEKEWLETEMKCQVLADILL